LTDTSVEEPIPLSPAKVATFFHWNQHQYHYHQKNVQSISFGRKRLFQMDIMFDGIGMEMDTAAVV
jgi:hypothetical protein